MHFADDRLEISGHWSGVRGRRFVRPSLVLADGRRLLAVLDHKPWAPDAPDWTAAFVWEGETHVEGAMLDVAPGIEIDLPDVRPNGRMTKPARRETRFERPAPAAKKPPKIESPPPAAKVVPPPAAEAASPPPAPRVELPPAEATDDGRLGELRAELSAAAAERDSLTGDKAALVAERKRLEEQTAALTAERDNAVSARDAALSKRDEVVSRAEALEARLDALIAERDEAVAESDAHERQRDRAEEQCAAMERERDQAVAERDSLRRERAAIAPTDALRRAMFRQEPDEPPAVLWASRVLAITALLAGLTLLAIFFNALFSA